MLWRIFMRTIKLTIQVTLVNCLLTAMFGLLMTIVKGDIQYFFYLTIFTLPNIIIPGLLATIIFLSLKSKLWVADNFRDILYTGTTLTLIFLLGLITWSIIDILAFGDSLTFDKIFKDFKTQFLGFSPLTLSTAVALPILDKRIERRIKNAP
jgi:hypothetical protein